ncbi:MAG: hypothetical protein WBV55_16600 [Candidatus Sulfotelmatobacter sp.]
MEHAAPIIERARRVLRTHIHGGQHEPEHVIDVIDAAYAEHLQTQIENKILRKHGYDTESFKKEARRTCSPEIQGKVWDKIDRERLSLQFLVCGFDKERVGHIWVVDGENAPVCYDSIEFWAIGSGAAAALSRIALHISKYKGFNSVEEAIYVAMTAKFAAESASDVGRSTFMAVDKHPSARNHLEMLSDEGMERLRTIWNRVGIPPAPSSACDFIRKNMTELRKSFNKR